MGCMHVSGYTVIADLNSCQNEQMYDVYHDVKLLVCRVTGCVAYNGGQFVLLNSSSVLPC